MKNEKYKFIEMAQQGVNSRGQVTEINWVKVTNTYVDCYKTYFRYLKDILVYRKKNNSLREYHGSCYCDIIPIDIDRPKNLGESLRILKDFIRFLCKEHNISKEVMRCFFSGKKGFHLELPTNLLGNVKPSSDLPRLLKRFVLSLGDWGFDMSMYNSRQLYRIVNTINSKSGLYKIPLTIDEVFNLSIEEILELAISSRQELDPVDYEKVNANPGLSDLWSKIINNELHQWKQNVGPQINSFDFLKTGVNEGERNNTTFINSSRLKSNGINLNDAMNLISQWNKLNTPPLKDSEIRKTVHSGYRYNVRDKASIGILQYIRDIGSCHDLTTIQLVVLFILLGKADNRPIQWTFNEYMYLCNPGEVIFSYRKMSKEWSNLFTFNQLRSAMDVLERKGYIEKWSLGGKHGSMAKIIGLDFDTKIDTVKGVVSNINNPSLLNQDYQQFNC